MPFRKKLRMGVIGCGRIAQAHLAAAATLPEEIDLIALNSTAPQGGSK